MIRISSKGDYDKLTNWFERVKKVVHMSTLDKYGEEGVRALSAATPKDSGETASSWYYKIENKNDVARITFCNDNVNNGVPIAIILQYGHGTGTGGYVQGRDYINPVMRPLFDKIAKEAWEEVTKA